MSSEERNLYREQQFRNRFFRESPYPGNDDSGKMMYLTSKKRGSSFEKHHLLNGSLFQGEFVVEVTSGGVLYPKKTKKHPPKTPTPHNPSGDNKGKKAVFLGRLSAGRGSNSVVLYLGR